MVEVALVRETLAFEAGFAVVVVDTLLELEEDVGVGFETVAFVLLALEEVLGLTVEVLVLDADEELLVLAAGAAVLLAGV